MTAYFMYVVNPASVLLGAAVAMGIGMFWYSQTFLGKEWMRLSGLTKKQMAQNKSKMMPVMVANALIALFLSYMLGLMMAVFGMTSPLTGAKLAFLLWVGFSVPTALITALYENKSLKLFAINNGYHLVTMLAMGFVHGLWMNSAKFLLY